MTKNRLVVPEITITHVNPQIATTSLGNGSPPVIRIENERLLKNYSTIAANDSVLPNGIQEINKYQNGQTNYLRPHSPSESSESTPLLGSKTHQRKRSFGYKDKKFDEDAMSRISADEPKEPGPSWFPWKHLRIFKTILLSIVIILSVVSYSIIKESNLQIHQLAVEDDHPKSLRFKLHSTRPLVQISLVGAFLGNYLDNFTDDLHMNLYTVGCNHDNFNKKVGEERIPIVPDEKESEIPLSTLTFVYDLDTPRSHLGACHYSVNFLTNKTESFPFSMRVNDLPNSAQYGVTYAACILLGLYVLIIFEIVHRTLAAMIAATLSISVLALMNVKPSLEEIIMWIDMETVCLLFGMMVLVAILCETGFFDYVAVVAYKMAKGQTWTLLAILSFVTAVVSAFLDNVTTILLLTPVTIRLCEVMNLNPKYVLISLVIFSNVGGTATAVGDPPNVIIVSNAAIKEAGIEFANFTTHVGLGIVFVMAATYAFVFFLFRYVINIHMDEEPEVVEIKQEIQVWKRTAGSLSLYSRDENSVRKMLMQKVHALESMLKKKLYDKRPTEEHYQASLIELEKNYKIKDWPLLIKSLLVLLCIIVMFFLHSIPQMNISLGWIALMGAILLLILADLNELEQLLCWVEWSTLIFFAALFVVMEAMTKMGLLEFIGNATEGFVLGLEEEARLPVSIVLVLWISALASSFIDNIPFTTVMVKIVVGLADNPKLGLPLQPLVWALALGACLGGNGTLIGASANVVCAGVAEQHGYRFTFLEFFKVGFPTMLVTTTVAMIYLLICHVLIGWNS